MRRIIIVLICFFTFPIISQAQKNDRTTADFWDKAFIGGGLGLSFGTITSINLSPVIGYRITDDFSAGVGPIYHYYKDKRYNPDFETSIFGGALFARQVFLKDFFVQGEFQLLNLDVIHIDENNNPEYQRDNIPVLLLGGGYIQRFGNRNGILLSIMYDVIGDTNSPYSDDLVIRAGVVFGL